MKPKDKIVNSNTGWDNGDTQADKTGTDKAADKTKSTESETEKGKNQFDKPAREPDPDNTGKDQNADKTSTEPKTNASPNKK